MFSRYITIKRKAELANELSLSERQVRIYFFDICFKYENEENNNPNKPILLLLLFVRAICSDYEKLLKIYKSKTKYFLFFFVFGDSKSITEQTYRHIVNLSNIIIIIV